MAVIYGKRACVHGMGHVEEASGLAGRFYFFFYVDGAKLTTVQYQPSILLVVFCNGALFYNKKYF